MAGVQMGQVLGMDRVLLWDPDDLMTIVSCYDVLLIGAFDVSLFLHCILMYWITDVYEHFI